MAKAYSGRVRANTSASGGRATAKSGDVSSARLHQKSGSSNSFGGVTKVNHGNGTFSMERRAK